MKTYKHAKVRNNSQFIQIEACINNVRYRFSTKLLVTKENMDYVEFNYKELIEQYKNQKNIEANKDDPYLLSNYGYQVLELEKATCKESTYIRYYNVFKKHIVSAIGSMLISDFSPKIMKEVFVNKFSHLSFANRNIGICGIIGVLDELQEIAMSLFDLEYTNMRLESTLESIIHTCIRTIELLGYDSQLSLDMTIDKIMSRTGHFDTTLNKFIKDVSKEAQAKWIEPDYELARYINM